MYVRFSTILYCTGDTNFQKTAVKHTFVHWYVFTVQSFEIGNSTYRYCRFVRTVDMAVVLVLCSMYGTGTGRVPVLYCADGTIPVPYLRYDTLPVQYLNYFLLRFPSAIEWQVHTSRKPNKPHCHCPSSHLFQNFDECAKRTAG